MFLLEGVDVPTLYRFLSLPWNCAKDVVERAGLAVALSVRAVVTLAQCSAV